MWLMLPSAIRHARIQKGPALSLRLNRWGLSHDRPVAAPRATEGRFR